MGSSLGPTGQPPYRVHASGYMSNEQPMACIAAEVR
jgi:hypothetical protein